MTQLIKSLCVPCGILFPFKKTPTLTSEESIALIEKKRIEYDNELYRVRQSKVIIANAIKTKTAYQNKTEPELRKMLKELIVDDRRLSSLIEKCDVTLSQSSQLAVAAESVEIVLTGAEATRDLAKSVSSSTRKLEQMEKDGTFVDVEDLLRQSEIAMGVSAYGSPISDPSLDAELEDYLNQNTTVIPVSSGTPTIYHGQNMPVSVGLTNADPYESALLV